MNTEKAIKDLQRDVRNLKAVELSQFSGAKVSPSSTQSISNASWTTKTFNTTEFDTNTYFNGSNGFDVPENGYYTITGVVSWVANTIGQRYIRIRYIPPVGSTVTVTEDRRQTTATAVNARQGCGDTWFAEAGGEFRLEVWQNSGGNLNVNGQGNTSPVYFTIKKES